MILGLLVAQNIFFTLFAVVMIAAALKMVTTKNVVHAALYLVVVLACVAANYILLAAEFIATVQVLIYIGAVIVLFLFGIMLTRSPMTGNLVTDRSQWILGLSVAVPLAALLGWVLWDAFGDDELGPDLVQRTDVVGDAIFSQYLIPFEALSLLLLAALIGAVVLARRD
jgi:NADH-quinone oxidoreductase subunit J